jgi:hypothetical protein
MDLSKVVPLIGRTDSEGIKALEKLLEQMRRGEIVSMGFIGERSDGSMAIVYSPGHSEMMKMAGAAGMLQRRLQDFMMQNGKNGA